MITIEEQVGVAYAYPSSPQASAMGRGHSGTWYVQNGMDYILADGPRDAAAMAQQMIDGGQYHRSNLCLTTAATWGAILARETTKQLGDMDIVIALGNAREFYRGHGHDVSDLAITHTNGVCHAAPSPYTVRVCDGGGAYDFKIGPRGGSYVSRGDISRTLQDVALRAASVLGITA